jgi:hypothetical protein
MASRIAVARLAHRAHGGQPLAVGGTGIGTPGVGMNSISLRGARRGSTGAGGAHARKTRGSRPSCAQAPSRLRCGAVGVVHVMPVGGRIGAGMHQPGAAQRCACSGSPARKARWACVQLGMCPGGRQVACGCLRLRRRLHGQASWLPPSTTAPLRPVASPRPPPARARRRSPPGRPARRMVWHRPRAHGPGRRAARAGWRGCPTAGPASWRHHGARS